MKAQRRFLKDYEQDKKPIVEIKEKKSQTEVEPFNEIEVDSDSLKEDLTEIREILKYLLAKL